MIFGLRSVNVRQVFAKFDIEVISESGHEVEKTDIFFEIFF